MTFDGTPQTDSAIRLGYDQEIRQAIDAFRGYIYQLHQTVAAWMELKDNEEIYIEVAEDYAKVNRASRGIDAAQVKIATSLTLNSKSVREAIRNFLELQASNPGRDVFIELITTAKIGRERRPSIASNLAGIELWRNVAAGAPNFHDNIGVLRKLLITHFQTEKFMPFLRDSSDEELRANLIVRMKFRTGEPVEGDLDRQNQAIAATLVKPFEIKEGAGRLAYSTLLASAIRTALQPGPRRLDARQLHHCLVLAAGPPERAIPDDEIEDRLRRARSPLVVSFEESLEEDAIAGPGLEETKAHVARAFKAWRGNESSHPGTLAALLPLQMKTDAGWQKEEKRFRKTSIQSAYLAAFIGYLTHLSGNSDGGNSQFEHGFRYLQGYTPIGERLIYTMGVVDALRELGDMESAKAWTQRAEDTLARDPDFAPIATSVRSGQKGLATNSLWKSVLAAQAKLLHARALIFADSSKFESAAELSTESALFAEAADEPVLAAASAFLSADVARRSRKPAEAKKGFERVLELGVKNADYRRLAAFASCALAQMNLAKGRLPLSLYQFDRAIELVKETDPDDPVAAGIFYGDRAKALYRYGRFDWALLELGFALQGVVTRHPRCEVYSLRILGDVMIELDHRVGAADAYDKAVVLAQRIKNGHCLDVARLGRGRLKLLSGDFSGASDDFRTDTRDCDDDVEIRAEALSGFALASLLSNADEAKTAMKEALSSVDRGELSLHGNGWVWASLAAQLKFEGRSDESAELCTRAIDAFRISAPGLVGWPERLIIAAKVLKREGKCHSE